MSQRSKLTSLAEAAATVADGAALSFSGFGHAGHPMAFVRELIRQGRSGFTLNAIAECWPAEFLTGTGRVAAINMSNLMFEGLGRCRAISTAIERGRVRVDDHSHLALTLRLLAAGWNVPFLPIRSMAGTDLVAIQSGAEPKWASVDSPFGGGSVGLVSALHSDVAVIHVHKADTRGNGIVYGTTSVIDAQIRGARRVIVTTERVVSPREIVDENDAVIVPGILVDAVVHTPYGSHPGGMYGLYDEDLEHMDEYYEASRTDETLEAYHRRWTYDVADHDAHLAAVGSKRLFSLRVDPSAKFAMHLEA